MKQKEKQKKTIIRAENVLLVLSTALNRDYSKMFWTSIEHFRTHCENMFLFHMKWASNKHIRTMQYKR